MASRVVPAFRVDAFDTAGAGDAFNAALAVALADNGGVRNFDAFHLACAESGEADVFATTDDRLLALAKQHAAALRVRVVDVVTLAQEVFP